MKAPRIQHAGHHAGAIRGELHAGNLGRGEARGLLRDQVLAGRDDAEGERGQLVVADADHGEDEITLAQDRIEIARGGESLARGGQIRLCDHGGIRVPEADLRDRGEILQRGQQAAGMGMGETKEGDFHGRAGLE